MTKVTMSAVWDRTSEVLSGRAAMLAAIAVPTLFLPTIVRDAYVAYATPGTASFALIGGLLSLIVSVITIYGQLAIIAASSDPATDRAAALRIAGKRLLPTIGVAIVLGIAVAIAFIPALIFLGLSHIDYAAMAAGNPSMTGANGGMIAGAILYSLALGIVLLFVSARLMIWQAVLVNEHIGLRSIPRAWRLTTGSTWRIVGVIILFCIVLLVATGAAQSVVGIVFRLILGADHVATVTLIAAIAGSIVMVPLIVLAVVFTTQLYLACRRARGEDALEHRVS